MRSVTLLPAAAVVVAVLLSGCGASSGAGSSAAGGSSHAPSTAPPSTPPPSTPPPSTPPPSTAVPPGTDQSSTPLPTRPTGPAAGGQVVVDGVAERGVEPRCVVLRTSGRQYLLLGKASSVPLDVPVRVRGALLTGVLSYCQQGTPLRVDSVTRR